MDKIIWQLDADSSKVRADMVKVTAASQTMGDRIRQSWGGVESKQKSLLESNNRVTNQIQGFTRTLLNANSATDILASGLDRLENSLNLSLAGGAMIAGGAVIVDQIGKFQAQLNELEKAWQNVMKSRPDASFQNLSQLGEHLKEIIALREKLEKIQSTPNVRIGQELASNPMGLLFGIGNAQSSVRQKRIDQLRDMEDANKFAAVDKRRVRSDLDDAVSKGAISPYEAEAAKLFIAFKEANPAVHELTVATIELNRAFAKLAQTTNDKMMERSGATLSEMQARGGRSWQASLGFNEDGTAMDPAKFRNIKAANEALRLKGAGEVQRLDLNPDAAHDLFNQSGEAAAGITGLKPSEKMSTDFKGALQVVEANTAEIAKNTANQFVNK